jgi:hypothetical protein
MNFSVVVRFFREAVGMFFLVSVVGRQEEARMGAYVIDRGESAIRSSYSPACVSETLECLLLLCKHLWGEHVVLGFAYW